MEKLKTPQQMERHLKGIANHYRIEILLLVADNDGITLDEVIEKLDANEKTIGEHARRLAQAGLIDKHRRSNFAELSLSPYGRIVVRFLRAFQRA